MIAMRTSIAGLFTGVVFLVTATSYGVLVAYYPMNEANDPSLGTTVADASATPHDGIVATDGVPGAGVVQGIASANAALYGTAYRFSSAPTDLGYVDINPNPAFTFLTRDGALSYAAWIKPDATQQSNSTFIGTNGSAFDFRLAQSGSDWSLLLQSGNTATSGLATVATIPSDVWTHVAVTKDINGSAGTNLANVSFYINGVLAETGTVARAGTGTTRRLFLGTGCCADSYFNGGLDEVHVYNNVLNAYSIALLAGTAQAGDYNLNGAVDGADYVLWRKDPANPNFGGDPVGYDNWRLKFGSGSGAGSAVGSGQPVPEPSVIALGGVLASLLTFTGRRRAVLVAVPA